MTNIEPGQPEPRPDASVEDIQADIEATRHELGQTVEALTAKLDVKQQAKQKVDDTKKSLVVGAESLRSKGSEVTAQTGPAAPVAAMALLALIVGVIIWRRRA